MVAGKESALWKERILMGNYAASPIRNTGHDGYRLRSFEDSYSLSEGVVMSNSNSFGRNDLAALNACLKRRGLARKWKLRQYSPNFVSPGNTSWT